jgi:hypothetical protein
MDRHLNAFVPYQHPTTHEDQLTRAAVIVMRAIPLARDAFLARTGCRRSGELPAAAIDIQTSDVVTPAPEDLGKEATIAELVSVFLSPDEQLDLSQTQITEREAEQRLDGVIRFEDELVIVIESKVVGRASSQQASELRLRGVTVGSSRVLHLGWHDVLGDWWALLERGLLSPAEAVLIEDLAGLTEEHFPHLLPFSSLIEAGDNRLRRQRRLAALLRAATGLPDIRTPEDGKAIVMLDAAVGTSSTQRLMLGLEGDQLVLSTAAAELKPQALEFYGTDRGAAAVSLADDEGWSASPNLYLGYRGAHTLAQRLYPSCQLSLEEYVRRLSTVDIDRIGGYRHDEVRSELWPWLRERGYAGPGDDEHLDAFLEGLGRRDAHLRPSLAIRRSWSWDEAERLDERGEMVAEIRAAIRRLLTQLQEPLPPACADAGLST